MREQSQGQQEMLQTPAKKRDNIPTVVPSCTHPHPRSCPLSGLSLALSVALSPCFHIMFVVLPLPDLFLWAVPSTHQFVPFSHLPHSYPDLISLSLYIHFFPALLALVPLYLLYIYISVWTLDEITKGVAKKKKKEKGGRVHGGRLVWQVKGPSVMEIVTSAGD